MESATAPLIPEPALIFLRVHTQKIRRHPEPAHHLAEMRSNIPDLLSAVAATSKNALLPAEIPAEIYHQMPALDAAVEDLRSLNLAVDDRF